MLGGIKWWMTIKWISKQGEHMERPREWNVNKETMSKDINERGQL